MRTKRTNQKIRQLMSLLVVTLLLAGAGQAQATVRVRATVRTPYGAVHVDNRPSQRYWRVRAPRVPVQRYHEVRLTRHDRKIAKRLAWYTGVPKREILTMKRQGYYWSEIGRWLDVPRQVVRAAKHKRSWRRFLHDERYYEVSYYDGPARHHGRGWDD